MKKIILFCLFTFLCVFPVSAFAYDIQKYADIPLPGHLTGIAVDSATGTVAAITSETKTLYLIDTNSKAIVNKIALDISPSFITIDAARNTAIIASKDGTLNFVELDSESLIRTIATGEPITFIAANQDGDTLLTASGSSIKKMALDTGETLSEKILPLAIKGISDDSVHGNLGLLLEGRDGLFLYDADTLTHVSEIKTGYVHSGIAINPSSSIAILANNTERSISIVSLESKELLATIKLDESPMAVAVDTSSNIAFIAHNNGISVIQLQNPVPSIDRLVPDSSAAGTPGITLSIEGSKFLRNSNAKFDLRNLETIFQSNYNLKAVIPPEELLIPREVPVSVLNPPPGGGSCGAFFRVLNPLPVADSLEPDTVALTRQAVDIKIRGKNFLPNSEVNLNGNKLKTTFISSILLQVHADLKDTGISEAASYPVTVTNPSTIALTSNTIFLEAVDNDSVIDAKEKKKSEADSLQTAAGTLTGTLTGRILNTNKDPIEGVTLQIKGMKARTDSDGYFTLTNVPSGKQHLMVHGSTAIEPNSHYPTIPLTINIESGGITQMPFQIYLHRQKNYNFANIDPANDTILTDPEVPGFEMRIPKGDNITGWDGQHNQKVSVRTVPIDRLPVKPIPNEAHARTVYMFYFGKIGGGRADSPIPVKMPNDLGLLPGQKSVIWYFDESPNEGEAPNDWAIAGTGTVTPDGKYIVSDPGAGIPKFCCGAVSPGGGDGPPGPPGPPPPPGCGGPGDGPQGDCDTDPSGHGGEPVELSSGLFIYSHTDLHIPGIIPVNITRYHRPGDTGLGAFGAGTYLEYDWWLGAYGPDGSINKTNPTMLLLVKPGNSQHRFPLQPDGTFIDTADPEFSNAKIVTNGDGTRTLKMGDGRAYKFTYQDRYDGQLMSIEDRNGNRLTFTRTPRPPSGDDQGGYLTSVTTQEGRTVTFSQTYTGNFFRTDQISDSSGRTVRYTYETDPFSAFPRLKQVTLVDGSTITYGYDSSGRMNTITNQRGIVQVANVYDSNNRVIQQSLADQGVFYFYYVIAGGYVAETSITAPNGAVTTWRFYDDSGAYRNGYVTKKTTPDGTTTYVRQPGTNLVTSVTDPLGRTKTYTYYSTNDVTNGLIETKTDPLGNVTSYTYETNYGMPATITDALTPPNTTGFTYTYDSNNRVIQVVKTDPLSHTKTTNYNTSGTTASITDSNTNTTTFDYDPAYPAQLSRITDSLGNSSTMTYDSLGRLDGVTDAKGITTSYTYDTMDRVATVTDALNGVTEYTYDADGNLIAVVDPNKNMIQYTYDSFNRPTSMTDQLNRSEYYTYDTSGNMNTYRDRKGQVTTYTYDLLNRVKHVTYHDGSYTDYTYDHVGRVDYINDSISGYIDYTYNDFGCGGSCSGHGYNLIAEEKTPLGTIDYTYDQDGRRATMTVDGQPVVNYVYDAAGRMTSIGTIVGGSSRTYTLDYDNGNRRTSLQQPLSTTNQYVTTTYSPYDNANRILGISIQGPSNQIENLGYTYDANGKRSSYGRIAAQPLRDTVTSVSYDNANEMLAFTPGSTSPKNMTYDASGNLRTSTNSCGTTTYTWDVRKRLAGISGYTSTCAALAASFSYDALGRRISKTINGTTTQYVYDGLDIIQEIQGLTKTNYIRTLNIDEPLTRVKADGTVRHYVRDALGSILALTDDSGVVKTIYTYDPFGNVTISGEALDNPLQYTGRENDGTGLYYYRARYYSPELQRFISEDPIGLKGGINKFAYVNNRPTNLIDPEGKSVIGFGICLGLTVYNVKSSYNAIEKLYKEWKEARDKLDKLNERCKTLEDEARYAEQLKELEKQVYDKALEMVKEGLIDTGIQIAIMPLCFL